MPGGLTYAAAKPDCDGMGTTCLADHEEHLFPISTARAIRLILSHYMSKSYAFVKKALLLQDARTKRAAISLESAVFLLFSAHILLHN
jgi:hypothetical protein